jgi:AAA ATPase domain
MESWGDLIDEKDSEYFVGREQELDIFSREITPSQPRFLLFYITGQGGVGKTTLLHRYRTIAQAAGFLLADADQLQRTVPAMLGRFAYQLAEKHLPLKRFDERYKTYRQKTDEIANDPQAPHGLAAMLGKTMIRATYIVGDMVPGLRQGLDSIPREPLEAQS